MEVGGRRRVNVVDLNPIVKKNYVLKLHKIHGCVVDRLNNYYATSISHHLVNAALTKCRLKHKIDTHPIPLPIRVIFIRLGYLARITAPAHGHWNTTRQRQRVEGIFGHLAITTIESNLF